MPEIEPGPIACNAGALTTILSLWHHTQVIFIFSLQEP